MVSSPPSSACENPEKDQTFPVTTQQIYAYHTLVGVIMIIKSEPYENTIDGTALKWE
jgi:hypothetical protein